MVANRHSSHAQIRQRRPCPHLRDREEAGWRGSVIEITDRKLLGSGKIVSLQN